MVDNELIVLLDDDWQPIGQAPKLASHNDSTPLHLAFSCYVFNDRGAWLMTRRALGKKVWPGVWTNTCCGHPAPGESTEDAVHRRLRYELGMKVHDLKLVLPKFRYRAEFQGIVENECCPVYIAEADTEPNMNPEEVMECRWFSPAEMAAEVTPDNERYSQWCRLAVPLLREQGVQI